MSALLHVAADSATAAAAAALLGGEPFSPANIAAGETPMQAWGRTLRENLPAAVLVHDPGPLPPEALWVLREREIPYVLALPDFFEICPTRRLWNRRNEICSGPGAAKCARCIFGPGIKWPLLQGLILGQFRHRPRRWQAAMAGAEVLLAPSRFLRDAWLGHDAPADRLIVLPPAASAITPPPSALAVRREPRTLVFTGGWDEANGANLLAQALERIPEPVILLTVGQVDAAGQAAFRAALPSPHHLEFTGPLDAPALDLCLRTATAALLPSRWADPYGSLLDAAQLAGTPPVATAVGGMPERIIHGLNGFLADPDDPASLAQAINSALAANWDPQSARRRITAEAASTLATWRALAAALPAPPPNLALELGFAPLLAAAREEFALPAAQAGDFLRAALTSPATTSIEPGEQALLLAIPSQTRARRVRLNHALACLHAGEFRRVLVMEAGLGDAVQWFRVWGLEAAGCAGDGLGGPPPSPPLARLASRLGMPPPPPAFQPEALFLEATVSTGQAALRRRFPSAQAVLADRPEGLEVMD